jgi:colanic acid biosynthesis glycosyl transferase WcaI
LRILIHGINYSPELTGIGKYTGEMAEWLASRGHEVRVVTAPPYYPQWKVTEGFAKGWRKEQGKIPLSLPLNKGGKIVVYRCPLWVPSKPSGLKRLLHLVSFALSSFPIMLWQIFWRPEVVLVVEPPFFCAPQAWLVARLSGGKAWLHIQDYEVDAAFELGLLKGIMLRRLVASCERWVMRRFDRISTISQRMLDRAVTKGVVLGRAILFPNWVKLELTGNGVSGSNRYRMELTIPPDAVVALYSGNMGGKQGLEILAQAAMLLRDALNLQFVFCGNGAGRADLVALCDALPNVQFMDLQPSERLDELLAMADIHLLPQRADAADLVMPSKLTGMLASGRPVVVTAHSDTELANAVSGCGLVVEPEQPQAFADAIRVLAQDTGLRTRLGLAGRAYAEKNLDRNVVLARFEAELSQLVAV